MAIKFYGLPSKCILLILMGYKLTDWVSTTVWYDNHNIIIINIDGIQFDAGIIDRQLVKLNPLSNFPTIRYGRCMHVKGSYSVSVYLYGKVLPEWLASYCKYIV